MTELKTFFNDEIGVFRKSCRILSCCFKDNISFLCHEIIVVGLQNRHPGLYHLKRSRLRKF
ncbi:hypothetical protein BE845_11475 [Legionella pneumophila subsp. pneumophila]|nr:hypothetical protein BE841_01015 [Legionella pneumophila subsp. pneumophila]AOW55261.1 hypothetical protein BE842_07740 [Legionella pneumophila subsp. pneumophila]AOW59187.1 hypothetical protein BE843_13390 [Legionella pneumophila subsp. pneumophila]AOW60624.1 hypothetical protein BE844_05380 [Legionella pneumophila subsp. pneumophila]AOW64644.1 hypothetical protein BE845_11475 [Legionella pneumophila subsp. pneumophila]